MSLTPRTAVRRTQEAAGLAPSGALRGSVRFLATEVTYFVRQGHAHRLSELLAYEFTRWAGFQAGRLGGRVGSSWLQT
ncbi:hypothetical protein BH24GEM3_BH24GEM3_08740 [soil metagenome]